jgi:hypothetical protein
MSGDVAFPKPCVLCIYFMLPEDAMHARHYSVAIGDVCDDCKVHTESAATELGVVLGIASRPLEDGERRNNSRVINCTDMHQRQRRKKD